MATQRLWDKGDSLDTFVHRFTVGDDPQLDRQLAHFDCLGSAAHVHALARLGILTHAEAGRLLTSLQACAAEWTRFEIPWELEDCHTAIESRLTEEHGELGRKIHAGRSRNDQVATASRMYMRFYAHAWLDELTRLVDALLTRIESDGDLPLPGHTHLRAAMPASIGLWLHSVIAAATEQQQATLDLLERLDTCPLGTAAGFGSPLPLDRELTARLLGFSRPQANPIDVQNARGRMELYYARVAADIGAVCERLASDLMLYCLPEFGFARLPDALTTGSSIMPQKRNPDVLELVRAHGARLRAAPNEIQFLTTRLTSGYHRDLQLTKGPMIAVTATTGVLIQTVTRVVPRITFDAQRLRSAMTPELYATHAAVQQVLAGVPFRDAYRAVAAEPERDWKAELPPDIVRSAGRLDPATLAACRDEQADLRQACDTWAARLKAVPNMVFAAPAGGPAGVD